MSTSPPPNPLPPDEDRAPALMGMFWAWTGVSILLVSLRFYVRSRIRGRGWDDWMMLLSVVLLALTACFISYLGSVGGSRHVWYLTDSQRLEALKWSWVVQPPSILLFATSKTSVAILQLRLVRRTSPWYRYTIYGVIAAVFVANILTIVFTFAQCNPARALWTPSLVGKCWDPKVQLRLGYFFAAVNILADVVLAALPSTFVLSLKIPLAKRIGLSLLLGFGIVAAVFGIIKTAYLPSLTKRGDFTWNAYPIQAWSGAEGFVLIFCGNLPPLQPLWDALTKKKGLSRYGHGTAEGHIASASAGVSSSNRNNPGSGGAGFSPMSSSTAQRGSKPSRSSWAELKDSRVSSSDENVLLEPPRVILATTEVRVSRDNASSYDV